MLRVLVVALASLAWSGCLLAQGLPTLPTTVLTAVPGNPASQLLAVDSATGAAVPLAGFPSDHLSPLAIYQDRINGALLVALDEGGGSSRVIRLQSVGATFVETFYASVPGPVVDLAIVDDKLFVAVDAANGGVYQMPRRGGAVTMGLSMANLTAMTVGTFSRLVLAWTGRAGTSVVASGVVELPAAQLGWPQFPVTFPNPSAREIVGVVDLPGLANDHLLALSDGSFMRIEGASFPMTIPVTPAPAFPFAAPVAMHPRGIFGHNPVVLGESSQSNLGTINPWHGIASVLSPALPGVPVDFVFGESSLAHTMEYGNACGVEQLDPYVVSEPEIGGQLLVAIDTQIFMPLLFAAGLSDFVFAQLPATLPGGCLLQIVPDFVSLEFASALGTASKAIPIPAVPSLLGTVVHTQWAHFDPTGFSVSTAMAHWVGN